MLPRLLLGLGVVAACTGCEVPSTQLVVFVTADPALSTQIAQVEALAGVIGDEPTCQSVRVLPPGSDSGGPQAGQTTLPFSFGVVPQAGDPSRIACIEVRGTTLDGSLVIARRVQTGFIEERQPMLVMKLDDRCAGKHCVAAEPESLEPCQELRTTGPGGSESYCNRDLEPCAPCTCIEGRCEPVAFIPPEELPLVGEEAD